MHEHYTQVEIHLADDANLANIVRIYFILMIFSINKAFRYCSNKNYYQLHEQYFHGERVNVCVLLLVFL